MLWGMPAYQCSYYLPSLCRYERLLALMHSVGSASLLVGVPGTAKVRRVGRPDGVGDLLLLLMAVEECWCVSAASAAGFTIHFHGNTDRLGAWILSVLFLPAFSSACHTSGLWHMRYAHACQSNPNTLTSYTPLNVQTCVVNQFLGRFSTETMATKTITFSSLTTPQIFQVINLGCCVVLLRPYPCNPSTQQSPFAD